MQSICPDRCVIGRSGPRIYDLAFAKSSPILLILRNHDSQITAMSNIVKLKLQIVRRYRSSTQSSSAPDRHRFCPVADPGKGGGKKLGKGASGLKYPPKNQNHGFASGVASLIHRPLGFDRSLLLSDAPPPSPRSGSSDYSVRVWRLSGEYLATLGSFVPYSLVLPRFPPDVRKTASFTTFKVTLFVSFLICNLVSNFTRFTSRLESRRSRTEAFSLFII